MKACVSVGNIMRECWCLGTRVALVGLVLAAQGLTMVPV